MVAAGHPAVVAAAQRILDLGGNAVDAVIAGGLVSTLTEPGFTSLAGGGFCLVADASNRVLIDFFVNTPGLGAVSPVSPHGFDEVEIEFEAATQLFHCGPASIAVPGVLSGYLHMHRRFGLVPLSELVAPTIELATSGVELAEKQAGVIALLQPILARTVPGRAMYAPDGVPIGAGALLRNQNLADTLAHLSATGVGFEGGELRAQLLELDHCLVTEYDLDAYRVIERDPLAIEWLGATLLTNPAPSFGGRLIAATLSALPGERSESPEGWPVAVGAALRHVDETRHLLLDPNVQHTSRGTTHISVWDGNGQAASMTTSNGECSGDLIGDSGIMANNILGEDDLHPQGFGRGQPGQRVASMMSPSVVLDAEGQVQVILGSGGSKRIRSTIVQVLVRMLAQEASPSEAVNAPRLHWDEDHFELEPGFSPAVLDALASSAELRIWPGQSVYFGGAHVVAPGFEAAGDPRRDGTAS